MKEVENLKGLVEPTADSEEEVVDPMSPEIAPGLSLIVLMRIYDVQLTLLRETNPEVAERLVNLHAEGKILGPMPWVDPEAMS